jgi:aromatic ring-opening dioxygenase catalytic subunit (LigB family)
VRYVPKGILIVGSGNVVHNLRLVVLISKDNFGYDSFFGKPVVNYLLVGQPLIDF